MKGRVRWGQARFGRRERLKQLASRNAEYAVPADCPEAPSCRQAAVPPRRRVGEAQR